MTTFDDVIPYTLEKLVGADLGDVELILNRDLNGRVRVVAEASKVDGPIHGKLLKAWASVHEYLPLHTAPPESALILEESLDGIRDKSSVLVSKRSSSDITIRLVDRLVRGAGWHTVAPSSKICPRVVYFSIKGGVGRSTALAATAWKLAQDGRRVMVLDLDLESPGISTNLLPDERRPRFGICDWLVEDLLENGNSVVDGMIASSPLSHDGEIYVIPAHGADPEDYISKLGRAWMGKPKGREREDWSARLGRLIDDLESKLNPDVILIDSRAGIDDTAASCVTDLGASIVFLFAIDGQQTWSGYDILFKHWNRMDVAISIRERLQVVGAMIPDDERRLEYFSGLLESSWATFSTLYDEVPPGASTEEFFNFDSFDIGAPHYPIPIRWNAGFSALKSVHGKLSSVDLSAVRATFGELIDVVEAQLESKK